MFPPARCVPSERLLGTCPELSYIPYQFHNGLGRTCRLIFLTDLPTALQTAEALFTHFFRHYRVPECLEGIHGTSGGFTPRVMGRWRE
jgi:hypothetical protein